MNELNEAMKTYLLSKAAEILRCDASQVFWESDIDEYGFESMQVNQFCADLNQRFCIDTRPTLFLEVTSLAQLSEYLTANYFDAVESKLLS